MSKGHAAAIQATSFATLVWTVPVRIVDISRSGCRLETSQRMQPGMSGQLTLSLWGRLHEDDVRIARCQLREGAGNNYYLGAELLRTRPLNGQSLRMAIGRLVGEQEPGEYPPDGSLRQALPDRKAEQLAKGVSRAPPVPADIET